jgi:hypothetical protein
VKLEKKKRTSKRLGKNGGEIFGSYKTVLCGITGS